MMTTQVNLLVLGSKMQMALSVVPFTSSKKGMDASKVMIPILVINLS
jgi:hypothetical protein